MVGLTGWSGEAAFECEKCGASRFGTLARVRALVTKINHMTAFSAWGVSRSHDHLDQLIAIELSASLSL